MVCGPLIFLSLANHEGRRRCGNWVSVSTTTMVWNTQVSYGMRQVFILRFSYQVPMLRKYVHYLISHSCLVWVRAILSHCFRCSTCGSEGKSKLSMVTHLVTDRPRKIKPDVFNRKAMLLNVMLCFFTLAFKSLNPSEPQMLFISKTKWWK